MRKSRQEHKIYCIGMTMNLLRSLCSCAVPSQLTVSCNEVAGLFIMDGIKVICRCKECVARPKGQREFHPTHWEQHCGAGTAKKWKASIKIEPGGAPEVPQGSYPMQIGKWFDMLGVEFRPARTTGGLASSLSARTLSGERDSNTVYAQSECSFGAYSLWLSDFFG